jgi:hypothetical protein
VYRWGSRLTVWIHTAAAQSPTLSVFLHEDFEPTGYARAALSQSTAQVGASCDARVVRLPPTARTENRNPKRHRAWGAQASNAALEEGLAALETELRHEVVTRHDELLEQVGSLQETETSLAGVRGQVQQLQVKAPTRMRYTLLSSTPHLASLLPRAAYASCGPTHSCEPSSQTLDAGGTGARARGDGGAVPRHRRTHEAARRPVLHRGPAAARAATSQACRQAARTHGCQRQPGLGQGGQAASGHPPTGGTLVLLRAHYGDGLQQLLKRRLLCVSVRRRATWLVWTWWMRRRRGWRPWGATCGLARR